MPIYEYACRTCGHTLDELQKISDEPLIDCPECGQPQLKRLISAPRFRLKGDGWYETDFKKDNQRNLSKGEGEAATGSGKSDSSDSSGSDKRNGVASDTEGTTTKTVEKSSDSKSAPAKASDSKPAPAKVGESKSPASKSE